MRGGWEGKAGRFSSPPHTRGQSHRERYDGQPVGQPCVGRKANARDRGEFLGRAESSPLLSNDHDALSQPRADARQCVQFLYRRPVEIHHRRPGRRYANVHFVDLGFKVHGSSLPYLSAH
jgi:hypothetical protein